jgi:hypothetical protein
MSQPRTRKKEPIMSTATAALFPVSADLPVTDGNGTEVFTVEYRDTSAGELVRAEFGTELQAVRCMGAVDLYTNLVPVAVGRNVDASKFRH